MYQGINIGTCSIKFFEIDQEEKTTAKIIKHNGNINECLLSLFKENKTIVSSIITTGSLAKSNLSLKYVPETICVEVALNYLKISPDIVVSLGGENTLIYCLKDNEIKKVISLTKCAAGSGEFIVQQLDRMGLGLKEGLSISYRGEKIDLASRCSVHCKTDATHKLNKGECTKADVIYTLIENMAERIEWLIRTAQWPKDHIILIGGLVRNRKFVNNLQKLLKEYQVETIEQSLYLEAFGAAHYSTIDNCPPPIEIGNWFKDQTNEISYSDSSLSPLMNYKNQIIKLNEEVINKDYKSEINAILGVDAGSTTTKMALLDINDGKYLMGCYLPTHGNPIQATIDCLNDIIAQHNEKVIEIKQIAVTGSARELVSVFLNNSLSFNEILAHARAACFNVPDVDTIFEIGGQDSKFITLQSGIPVDYAMNDSCSAGTGSFLEEAAKSDLKIKREELGPLAEKSKNPIVFNERCAAFINSEIRMAFAKDREISDVAAGLVYSIINNYLSKVVGNRQIGNKVLLQGGVALNSAVCLAVAACTGKKVVIPPKPELMGCIGAALLAKDLLEEKKVEKREHILEELKKNKTEDKGVFSCKSCKNICEIRKLKVSDSVYPFGGLCSKWEMQRKSKSLRKEKGIDLINLRHKLMFEEFAPPNPINPKGRVGIPLVLMTYVLYPFFSKMFAEFGYQVVLSNPKQGRFFTYAPMCYPAELLHVAVDELFKLNVDYIFLPSVTEMDIPEGHSDSYLCPYTQKGPAYIKQFFGEKSNRIISPDISFSQKNMNTVFKEIKKVGKQLNQNQNDTKNAFYKAWKHQKLFESTYKERGKKAIEELTGPKIVFVGYPYIAFSPELNMSIPQMIVNKGFNVIPSDMLPFDPPPIKYNTYYFSQIAMSAISFAKKNSDYYICYLSCYACPHNSSFYHRLMYELKGYPFCYLEIDSHSSPSGIATRVGAFLDIIDKQISYSGQNIIKTSKNHYKFLIKKATKKEITTEDGNTISIKDKKISHLMLADLPKIHKELTIKFAKSVGINMIIQDRMDNEQIRLARKIISGRVCLPYSSMVGGMLQYLDSRDQGEITVVNLLNDAGPCQDGNFYDLVSIILTQLDNTKNVFVGFPTVENNYLGYGDEYSLKLLEAVIIGDILEEIMSVLKLLAKNPLAAKKVFQNEKEKLLNATKYNFFKLEYALKTAIKKLSQIALKRSIKSIPRILLIGCGDRVVIDRFIKDFFENRGILTKTSNFSLIAYGEEGTSVYKLGYASGHSEFSKQMSYPVVLKGVLKGILKDRNKFLKILKSRINQTSIDFLYRRWAKLASKSGLLFSDHFSLYNIMNIGSSVTTCHYNDATFVLGTYLKTLEEKNYDAIVNLRTFNCPSAEISEAMIRPIANKNSMLYASIELDGEEISTSQKLELETIAEQCWKRHKRN